VTPDLVQHLGALHPMEQVLTLLLAFGPFAVLAIVIAVRRRADADETPVALTAQPER
jgi:hypothetical protein